MYVNLNLMTIIKSELCFWNPFSSINLNYVTDWGPFNSINLNYISNWNNYNAYNLALVFSLETKLNPWKYSISIVRIKSSRALRPWSMFLNTFWLICIKMAFLPQNKKNFVVSCFSRSLNCSSPISRYMLGHIWGLD